MSLNWISLVLNLTNTKNDRVATWASTRPRRTKGFYVGRMLNHLKKLMPLSTALCPEYKAFRFFNVGRVAQIFGKIPTQYFFKFSFSSIYNPQTSGFMIWRKSRVSSTKLGKFQM